MKKFHKLTVLAALALGSIGSAQAVVMDELIGSISFAAPNSSPATELAQLQTFPAAADATFVSRIDGNGGATLVDGLWTINLGAIANPPEYFALKLGNGGTDVAQDTYFFRNSVETNILAWSDAQVNNLTGGLNNTNIGRLSHVSFFDLSFQNGLPPAGGPTDGGGGTAVPEPGTMALLGLGLLGFAVTRRRKA